MQPVTRNKPLHFFAAWLLLLPTAWSHADEIRVAVASNFRFTMEAAASRFEQQSAHKVTVIPGSTGKQYAQILNGAPFDAFFAADATRPKRLEAMDRIVAGTRFTYAVGRLVLWSVTDDLVDPAGEILRTGRFARLAIANPQLAPYGEAARQVLVSLGLWEAYQDKLVRGENIAQTFQFVFSGNAELGFIARSQITSLAQTARGSWWEPARSLYEPIEQQAVLLRETAAGREFLSFIRGPEMHTLIRAHGYDLPDVQ
jgi:molybdate transport system substrate-binding protein